MTEEQARTTHCCGPTGCGFPNGADAVYDGNGNIVSWVPQRWCRGSACMGWRWLKGNGDGPKEEVRQKERPADRGEGFVWVQAKFGAEVWGLFARRGYCGNAGPL